MGTFDLSIVIPVYNGEATIGELCRELIRLYAANYRLEIVLVNDCSRDGSDRVCRQLQQEFDGTVTYIQLARNFGEHNAVMAGLNHARGDLCVTIDDDFQNPPEEVARLLDTARQGYDVVYCRYDRKCDHWLRNLGSRFNDFMAERILRKPAGLYLSSFKIMNRFLVQEIVKYTGPDPYIDAIILRSTSNIGSVQVAHRERTAGSSGYTFLKLLSLWGNMMVSFSMIPLRVVGLVGFTMACFSVFMFMDLVFDSLFPTAQDPTDFDSLAASMTFFRGFVMLSVALLGEYVGRIYLAINGDPQYVIRESLAARRTPHIVEALPAREPNADRNRSAA